MKRQNKPANAKKPDGKVKSYFKNMKRVTKVDFATYIGGGNSWSRKNTIEQNKRAKYPRYSWASANNNYAISDYWLFDGSYFRVKNISLGYTLPQKWMSKIHVKSLRFAVTLTDFFTHSHFPEGWDPEVGTTGYPITKSVLFSAQLKF